MSSALRLRGGVPMRLVRRQFSAMVASRSTASPFRVMADCRLDPMMGGGDRMTENFFNINGGGNNYSRRFLHSSTVLFQKYPAHTIFALPALSPTMEMGTIGTWNLKEGDSFGAGDVLCSIETDKATVDFEAQDDGILAKILRAPPNASDIPVGSPICVIVDDASDVAAFADFVIGDGTTVVEAAPTAAVAAPVSGVSAPVAAPAMASGTPNTLLPSARFLAESRGLDATGLVGSAKGGRVTKGDVLQALASGTALPPLAAKAYKPAPAVATAPVVTAKAPTPVAVPLADLVRLEVDTLGSYEDIPNNNMRKVIARRLTESKRDVPHFYTSMEVELDNVMKMRKNLASKHDVKVSVNDVIIRCCALALRDVPEVNSTYNPKTGTVKMQDTIDVSVAVATPTGLITPIVPNTDKMGLSAITDKVRDLAGRARSGKLKPEEYQGGTFCISNLGMFGIDEFSAVINPPQAAILAVGGGTRRVVPTPYVDGAAEQAKPTIKTIMTARLSADRRVIDEPTAALFMAAFKQYINNPELTLL